MIFTVRKNNAELTDYEKKYMRLYTESADGEARIREVVFLEEESEEPVMEPDDDEENDDEIVFDDDEIELEGDDEDDEPVEEPDTGSNDEGTGDDENQDSPDANNDGSEGGDGDEPVLEPDNEDDDAGGDDNGGGNSGDSDGTDTNDNKPEDKEEIIHKQNLFIKFNNIYDSIDAYTDRLDETIGKTDESNHRYREISDILKNVKKFTYDYMVIRFKDASYEECMLYYQRVVAVVNLCFDSVERIIESEKTKK